MAAVRVNILQNATTRDQFVQGVTALKQEDAGLTTDQVGIPRRPGVAVQRLSTYDLFVLWHQWAMDEATPPGSSRNAAHRGPVFLPWHRFMLILLEANFQRVLGIPDFGIPYWDWAADGELPIPQQPGSPLWAAECVGGDGDPGQGFAVTTGPFSAGTQFRVRLWSDSNGTLWAVERPLRRRFQASRGRGLPRKADVARAMNLNVYDAPPWDALSDEFRNTVEGWVPSETAPNLHNLVHVWISGDMSPGTSPNDPVFFLNHCNEDRIWAAWQASHSGSPYLPPANAAAELFRHRLNDPMFSILTSANEAWSPQDMLDVAATYTYDTLQVV